MTLLQDMAAQIGAEYVLTGNDTAKWDSDWTGQYRSDPIAVVRPANTVQISEIVKLAHAAATPIVPVSGNTSLAGGTKADGAILLSMDRLNTIEKIQPDARIIVVRAGVILSAIHDAVAGHDLIFPLTFGARGSAMVGGFLSTNAGGSNVLRYGNTRDLCLGIEVVMPDGQIMNLMSELHKDNSGLNLKNLMIGAEGTLGIITRAVFKLAPKPKAYATAMVAVDGLETALQLLNKLQEITGGAVEAFEYMPASYIAKHVEVIAGAKPPFDVDHKHTIMVEIASTAPQSTTPLSDGSIPLVTQLENCLATLLETDSVLDAIIAQNDTQRADIWRRREDAGEVSIHGKPFVNTDIALPIDKVEAFLDKIMGSVRGLDSGATDLCVCHLGDGNIHHTVFLTRDDPILIDQVTELVEELCLSLGGSFSAEHGIGISKLSSMARRKDKVALATMHAIKSALDPKGIMNPGKVFPPL
jgi:FAD/FMN-containing dehydrogenase